MPVPFLLEEMPVRKENERLPADVVVLTLLVESLRCGKEISLPVLQPRRYTNARAHLNANNSMTGASGCIIVQGANERANREGPT